MQQQQERTLKYAKRARRGFLINYIMILASFYMAIYSFNQGDNLKIFAWLFLGFGAVMLLYAELRIIKKRLIITDRRAILEEGIFSKHSTTIRYSSITEVTSRQNILQRILNIGTLHIKTAGIKTEHDLVILGVGSPLKIKGMIEHFMTQTHHV
ncbi:MAG: PH domain-containing protein [Nanoarchaeota archaeon]